ncbi:MAG TPA: hypothetical protein VH187_16560 [Scandinavium sp.]|jgi:hypothetical protein|uniref:hypothetical protein n=1 Tax=Scandinavium sp. TaxID=2830653 RepID=UPI002E2FF83A|nr:hypothetical protein [Scandinavium sp.]HEX4502750.1 hypothetical protein [Scandinavium sp.]
MFPMTKLDIAKYAVSMIVALKTTSVVEQQVEQHTSLDTDGIPVKVGCTVVGQYAAYRAKPYTDVAVERTFNWFSEKFNQNTESNEYKSDR